MTTGQLITAAWPEGLPEPERCVVVVDDALSAGHAANAAAVLTLTLGARVPTLPGPDFADADGCAAPGLYPAGLPVLCAPALRVAELVRRAVARPDVGVIGFPAAGQTTTDYEAFRAEVARTPSGELVYVGALVCGAAKPVRRLTGSFGLLR